MIQYRARSGIYSFFSGDPAPPHSSDPGEPRIERSFEVRARDGKAYVLGNKRVTVIDPTPTITGVLNDGNDQLIADMAAVRALSGTLSDGDDVLVSTITNPYVPTAGAAEIADAVWDEMMIPTTGGPVPARAIMAAIADYLRARGVTL